MPRRSISPRVITVFRGSPASLRNMGAAATKMPTDPVAMAAGVFSTVVSLPVGESSVCALAALFRVFALERRKVAIVGGALAGALFGRVAVSGLALR